VNEGFDSGQQVLNVYHGSGSAQGDGRKADQLALTHWTDTANTLGGHRVYVPPGTYRLEAPVSGSAYRSIHIRGAGPASVLKPQGYLASTGEATTAVRFTDVQDVLFEDLLFDGGNMTAPRLASAYGTNSQNATSLLVYPGFSLQAGDTVYIGDPTFSSSVWELNQVTAVGTPNGVGATPLSLAQPLAHGYGDRTRVAQKENGFGGHGVSITNARRVTVRNCRFLNILTTCIDVNQVDELIVEDSTFEGFTSAQAASCYFAARGFGVGGWDVAKGKFVHNTVRNVPGRRAAGVEIRTTETNHGPQGADVLDWLIEGNDFDTIGSLTDVYNSHGSCVNIIAGRGNVDPALRADVRRVRILGNSSYGVGDGHYWIGAPGGGVVAADNTMELSMYGPFLNINAPYAAIHDNTMKTGGLAGIEVDAISTGDYAVGNIPGHLNLRGITIHDNIISDLIHAQTGNGILVTTSSATNKPAAEAPRQITIHDNVINGCWSDGIHLTEPLGDILIHDNIILDANQGQLAHAQLTANSVSAPNGYQSLTVDSTAHFIPVQFVQIGATLGATTLNGAVSAGATSFVLAAPIAGLAVGNALWLGAAEATSAEIVVPTSVAGTAIGCAPLALAHASGVPVSSTQRPLVVSIDSPTQMTVQYNQGVWPAGTAVTSPFPGSAGIVITGSATYPGARIKIHDNRVGIESVAGSTQYGVLIGAGVPGPMTITDNDFTGCVVGDVRTVSGLAAYIDNPVAGGGGAGVQVGSAQFSESTGAGTYTGSVVVPAGATILDIVLTSSAVWNAFTSATMQVGDAAQPAGWYTGINLKTGGELELGEQISFNQPNGKNGIYLNNAIGLRQGYSATARTISGVVTTSGATGNLGRTRMLVEYVVASPQDASKV
jgi:hypothetical protein